MDELVKMFNSPAFWVGSVAVGLVSNFGTQWAYGRLAALGSRWARARVERRKAEFDQDIALIAAHPEGLPLHMAAEARLRWYATIWLIFAVFFAVWLVYPGSSPNTYALDPWWLRTFLRVLISMCLFSAVFATSKASQKRSALDAIERSLRSVSRIAPKDAA